MKYIENIIFIALVVLAGMIVYYVGENFMYSLEHGRGSVEISQKGLNCLLAQAVLVSPLLFKKQQNKL